MNANDGPQTALTWRPRRKGTRSATLVLPSVERIPGTVAVEYVYKQLSGYSKQSAWDLLRSAVRDGKLPFEYSDLLTEISHRDDSLFGPFLKPEEFSIARQALIDWVKKIVSTTDNESRPGAPLASPSSKAKSRDNDSALKTRERDSLMKLVIGMAIAGYRYDVNARRSEATKDICDDLAKLGIPLDPDTVRKWLREAAQYLPHDRGANE